MQQLDDDAVGIVERENKNVGAKACWTFVPVEKFHALTFQMLMPLVDLGRVQ